MNNNGQRNIGFAWILHKSDGKGSSQTFVFDPSLGGALVLRGALSTLLEMDRSEVVNFTRERLLNLG